MSRTCQICSRKPKRAILRSYSNKATLRRQFLNLQKILYQGEKLKICTKCMKSLYKTK